MELGARLVMQDRFVFTGNAKPSFRKQSSAIRAGANGVHPWCAVKDTGR